LRHRRGYTVNAASLYAYRDLDRFALRQKITGPADLTAAFATQYMFSHPGCSPAMKNKRLSVSFRQARMN
jgi:hypothetical protein